MNLILLFQIILLQSHNTKQRKLRYIRLMSKAIKPAQKARTLKGTVDSFVTYVQNEKHKHILSNLKIDLNLLNKTLFHWSALNHSQSFHEHKDKEILKKYAHYRQQYYEFDQFDSTFALLDNLHVNLDRVIDESIIYKSIDLFKRTKWSVRFNSKFVARLNEFNLQQILFIFSEIHHIADGNFATKGAVKSPYGYSRPLQTKTIPFNKFYAYKLYREKNLFYQIGLEKVPVVRNGIIKRYEYTQYIQFLDILGDQYVENKNKLDERINFFISSIFEDVARKDHSGQVEIQPIKYSNTISYLFVPYENQYTERTEFYCATLSSTEQKVYFPLVFKPYYVSNIENTSMIFDSQTKRWLSKDHLNYMERKKIVEYQKQISESMVKRFVDFQSAKTLVELLTKIPNFKVNLTEQEKDVIGQNGNVLAIGRSGTGKTTCAVLRLFSIEMLFKIRLSLFKKKFQETIKDVRCGSSDIEQTFGLHCIFLTASPVLTHEIQRYYKKLTDNIKSELERKKKKAAAEKQQKLIEEMKEKAEAQNEISVEEVKPEYIEEQIREKEEDIEVPEVLLKTESQRSAEVIEEEQEMNEEFKDIELKEDINNEDFGEEEQDIDELKNKFEENIKKYNTLFDLNEADYPGFFTVKSYIMLIDGVLPKPFFIRNKNTIIEQDSKASWHNERKGVMMIENYYRGEEEKKDIDIEDIEEEINYSDEEELEHQYLRQIQLRQNKEKQQLTKKLQKGKNRSTLSFEVDYDYFVIHFWPRVVRKYYSSRNITPHLVWTEIYSTIKGSAEAHQFPGQYLSQSAYMNLTANIFLTREEKLDIYETFCQYERWKISNGGYDIMDAVNYILNVIRFRGYDGPEIHYIMIDEVQDLPHAIVYLLSKTATYGVFYSGDTAQTIAKGVGFRFCDLKSLFNPQVFSHSLTLKNPVIKHLTVNFRSHNNILQLANSIVSSLEILFPKTIDRLKKEISDLSGPKPMILSSSDEELLFYVLCGDDQKRNQENQKGEGMKKPPLEFGCDQVIIVRDQQSKSKIPAMLQHALCLTIYEAKGLEFNDVILFNFFTESPCPEKWSILKILNVINTEVPKQDYERNLSKHKEQKGQKQLVKQKQGDEEIKPEQEEVSVEESFNKISNTYNVKKITTNTGKHFKDINDFAELCSELKLLYTAITRPRKTLIIYDQKESVARNTIEKLWQKLDVIEVITKELVMESNNKKTADSEEIKIFKRIIASTDKNSWKQQGLKMYTRGYFDQAMKCFERSGNAELYKKAEANRNADEATKKLIEIESERSAIKQGFHLYRNMNSNELSKLKKKFKHEEGICLKKFISAADIFEQLLMFKQAGQCYFSGKSFEKAYQSFCKAFMYKQAAQSLEMQNKYREAAEYYEKDDNYLKVIECLDLINEWVMILEKIHKFANKMSEYQKQALLKKYSALALEELVYEIEFENEEENKKPENNRVQVIEEKDSDEEDEYDSDEDPEIAAEREYERKISAELSSNNPSRKQSEVSEEQMMVEIKDSVYEKLEEPIPEEPAKEQEEIQEEKKDDISVSFSDLNDSAIDSSQVAQIVKHESSGAKLVEISFDDLNQSSERPSIIENSLAERKQGDLQSVQSSFSDLNAKYDNDLQPDLDSIRSMVDPDDIWVKNSISEITHKLHSEYSVFDDTEQNYNLNVKIIKTKGNIFVQDEIMRKIVNIVSIINSSIQQFFKQFKGYQSLITVSKSDNHQVVDQRPEISEFEDIDPKFINIILDTLESFKLFKLCLFVCNRYHMPSKAGRYLISLGMKYSTNCISNNVVNPILLAPSSYRKTEIEKGILASIALHSIYENVNAEFLKVKVTDNEEDNKNSLGTYFIQGLILEGAYKKVVFMINPQEALKVLSNYNDFQAYNSIFRQKLLKNEQNINALTFLQASPVKTQDIEFTIMLLRKVLLDYCVANKFETISMRYYKQFENSPFESPAERLKHYVIPDYLPFTKVLIGDKQSLISGFKLLIEKGYSILQRGTSVQIADFISCLLIIVHNEESQIELVEQLSIDQFLEFYRCANYIRLVLRKMVGTRAIQIIDSVLNLSQCYRIKYCKSMNFINDTFCFVHRTSTIANDLVENPKTNSGQFSYFFEQDYNLILSKTSRIVKIIIKKYENSLIKLYKKRVAVIKFKDPILPQDFIWREEDNIIKKALILQIDLMMDPKKKKKEQKAIRKQSKDLKPSIDFRMHNKDQHIISMHVESSESEEVDDNDSDYRHYRASNNQKMTYISSLALHSFLESSKNAKEIVDGKSLYGCCMNNYYREYTSNMGGYDLFDAIEFKKFKRIDLFSENILSVFDSLTLYSKHQYLAEILMLLLVQYKSIEGKDSTVLVTIDQLKYFENLQFLYRHDNPADKETKYNNAEVTEFVWKSKCQFVYKNEYVSDMGKDELAKLICDYLQVLKDEQFSQFVDFSNIILTYVLNIQKNNDINELLRKIINIYARSWKIESLYSLTDNKSVGDYQIKRGNLLSSIYQPIKQTLHVVEVIDIGNIDKAIEDSEFDYDIEGRIIEGKKRAATKIVRWWRQKRQAMREQKGQRNNYLEWAVDSTNIPQVKKPNILGDIRILKALHPNSFVLSEIDLLIQTEVSKQELLSFYLTTTISSSLDFHFILMNLNKIEQCRKSALDYHRNDIEQLREEDILEIKENLSDLMKTIQIWKNDEKWMREKNINLKKKKVFEVKWMTKNLGLTSILKKRAGLKKQEKLQQKKRIIKRIK